MLKRFVAVRNAFTEFHEQLFLFDKTSALSDLFRRCQDLFDSFINAVFRQFHNGTAHHSICRNQGVSRICRIFDHFGKSNQSPDPAVFDQCLRCCEHGRDLLLGEEVCDSLQLLLCISDDRDIFRPRSVADVILDAGDDIFIFIVFGIESIYNDRSPVRSRSRQCFHHAIFIHVVDRVGKGNDLRRGTMVICQEDVINMFSHIILKMDDVLRRSISEPEDSLGVITHNHQTFKRRQLSEQLDQFDLILRGILEFIDNDMAEVIRVLQVMRIHLEDLKSKDLLIVEVQQTSLFQLCIIKVIQLDHLVKCAVRHIANITFKPHITSCRCTAHSLNCTEDVEYDRQSALLPSAGNCEVQEGFSSPFIDRVLLHQVGNDPEFLHVINDLRFPGESEHLPVRLYDIVFKGVECADSHLAQVRPCIEFCSVKHFLRSCVSERHAADLFRKHAGFDEVLDVERNNHRFSGSGACVDTDNAVIIIYGLVLRITELDIVGTPHDRVLNDRYRRKHIFADVELTAVLAVLLADLFFRNPVS